jgi:hypothetical protein
MRGKSNVTKRNVEKVWGARYLLKNMVIYSSWTPRKSSSLPLKSSSQLFSLNASLIDVRVLISLEINTYPRRIRCSSNLGHIFRGEKVHLIGQEIRYINQLVAKCRFYFAATVLLCLVQTKAAWDQQVLPTLISKPKVLIHNFYFKNLHGQYLILSKI